MLCVFLYGMVSLTFFLFLYEPILEMYTGFIIIMYTVRWQILYTFWYNLKVFFFSKGEIDVLPRDDREF